MKNKKVIFGLLLSFSMIINAQIPVENGMKILFVGNSYTNNAGGLDEYVEQALAAGDPAMNVSADRFIAFAKDLDYLWNETDVKVSIKYGNWDIVVVQGYWSAIQKPDTFHYYVDKFDSLVNEYGGKTVLFMPWTGNPTASWMNSNKYNNDSEKFRDEYRAASERIGAPVAPCGWIWHDLVRNKPKDGLPDDYLYADDIHQNQLASYVNSYIFYSLFTLSSPVGLDYHYKDVTNVTFDESLRTAIQERVWSMMQDWLPATTPVRANATAAPALRISKQPNVAKGKTFDIMGRMVVNPRSSMPVSLDGKSIEIHMEY